MRIIDNRTEKQQQTHTVVLGGYRTNYGTGNDYDFWACRPADKDALRRWLDEDSGLHNIRDGVHQGHYTDRAIIRVAGPDQLKT
jgi:hypothetical protein